MKPLDRLTEVGFAEDSHLLDCTNHSENMTVVVMKPTNLAEIPVKEIIIVLGMLGLWIYSLVKIWKAVLK